ncbi:hypothetical protein GBF38_001827 [Nibea albiflora]|uniref:Uncharacterized protein n=1 Tax=Nibea albiflora TaxID=240163 RepID=A0ACB7EUB8_NIBAL|nr:hypothetical protein GBF38_001827 [Nibea albiflora]
MKEKKKHKEIKVLKKSKHSPEERDVGVYRPKRGISVPERRLVEGKKDAIPEGSLILSSVRAANNERTKDQAETGAPACPEASLVSTVLTESVNKESQDTSSNEESGRWCFLASSLRVIAHTVVSVR